MKEIEGFRVSSRQMSRRSIAVVAVAFGLVVPQASFAAVALKCVTKYFFFGHLRDSNERGDCTSDEQIDGPSLPLVAIDAKGGKDHKDDTISTVVAEVTTMKDDVYKTTLRQRPTSRLTTTAVAEGYLKTNSGSLLSVGYLGEVDPDKSKACVNSRFLKVTCEIVPADKK